MATEMKKMFKIGKSIFFIPAILLILSATSCYSQKMVQRVSDAKKLETNKEKFVGKSLKVLLDSIGPEIKYVYGNPENTWFGETGGTRLYFYFVDRDEYGEKRARNETPVGVVVSFQLEPNNTRKPLPKEGLKRWTANETKEYGDMIISNVRVKGGVG